MRIQGALRAGVLIAVFAMLPVGAACGIDLAGVGPGGASTDLADARADDAPRPPLGDAAATLDAPTSPDLGGDGGDASACKKTALILVEQDAKSLAGTQAALVTAGFSVTTVPNYATYQGTPAPLGSGVVVLLAGLNYPEMPVAGQQAITSALAAGTGLVTEEWAGYQLTINQFQVLAPYILFHYTGWTGVLPVTIAATDLSHPIWTGLPATFTVNPKIAVGTGAAQEGGTSIASASVGGAVVAPGVLVRDNGVTRVAETSLAPNYVLEDALETDPNVPVLFANMALWAARCR